MILNYDFFHNQQVNGCNFCNTKDYFTFKLQIWPAGIAQFVYSSLPSVSNHWDIDDQQMWCQIPEYFF